jgi:arsenate reductase (thioredoxin)
MTALYWPVLATKAVAAKKICVKISAQADIWRIPLTTKKQILFLCTHNSCRSQMAEALANHFLGDICQAYSAGTEATRVNLLAALVLTELSIDTSRLRSKTLDEFSGQTFDHVITLCGDANEKCPLFFGGVQRHHHGFTDPSRLNGSEEDVLPEFRRVRDEIKNWITDSFGGAQ